MKKLLSSLMALAISMNTCQLCLKNCEAMKPNAECTVEFSKQVKNRDENQKNDNSNNALTWSFDDGIVVEFNKNKARVTHKKTGFFKTLVKSVSCFVVLGTAIKVLSNNCSYVNNFFTASANMVQPLYDFFKKQCVFVCEAEMWEKGIKESFMNSKFYKVLVDAGLLKTEPSVEESNDGDEENLSANESEETAK